MMAVGAGKVGKRGAEADLDFRQRCRHGQGTSGYLEYEGLAADRD